MINEQSSHLLLIVKDILRKERIRDTLRIGTLLRKKLPDTPPHLISEAIELLLLREKAAVFGEWTENGFFTRQSLEQATTPLVAQHHAERFRGCKHILEVCTGAGFDTSALARVAERVTTIEANPRLAEMAEQNFAAQHLQNIKVVCGLAEDIIPTLPLEDFDGFWSDPSRRNERGQRIENPDEYLPSLSFLQSLNIGGVAGIKISPAVNLNNSHLSEKDSDSKQWQREWVGVGNECREQVLWKNCTIADGTASLPEINLQWTPPLMRVSPKVFGKAIQSWAGMILLEPHGCIIRSSFLAEFFTELNAELLDTHIAFGITGVEPPNSAWYQKFRVLEVFPFHRKSLRERIIAYGWGNSVEIKKRGFPETPDEIKKWLKLPSSKKSGTIIITRVGAGHIVFFAERI